MLPSVSMLPGTHSLATARHFLFIPCEPLFFVIVIASPSVHPSPFGEG